MNADLFERARNAYRAGDFASAVQMFEACKDASEISGEVDHLRGNALMKLGYPRDAAQSYARALEDTAYGKRGALLTNEGKALAATGDAEGAARCFTQALDDATYATPYKAYLGLGKALLELGRVADAGTAFRNAAIDGTNPAPASALASLGGCFVELGRPQDAVESYRTALDFATPRDDAHAINAGLGRALAAANRPTEALEAFRSATADGLYQLAPAEADARARAQAMLDAAPSAGAMAPAGMAETAPAAPGYGAAVDPLDPLGKSGAFMPDPSDTGFFTLTESEMIQQDRQEMKIRRKHRHLGLKIFIVILILVILAIGGAAFAYTRGVGFPSQQDAVAGLFNAVTEGEDASAYLAPNLSDAARTQIVSSIPEDATPTITNMDQSMTESTALVSVELSMGATTEYDVSFVRGSNHIGWAVASIELHRDGVSRDESDVADADAATADEADAASATADEADAAAETPAEDASGTDGTAE
ncbi:tetratricopeptide repeat protein [uncultured Enorma sp.]|uniref:tetratricopeptide repeat protein n=1 Tax=uncultured Enorma sp. TaxID=1714346 RepID=UPI00265DF93B|nr:tetratricopeptide repeat protein [uncultured Enorma sp.]